MQKVKQVEAGGEYAQYYTLKSLFNAVLAEPENKNAWTKEAVDRALSHLTKFSYLGAFRQYFRENGYDVMHPEAYAFLGDIIAECKGSHRHRGEEIAQEDEVRMQAYEIAEVPFNEIRA